MNVIVLKHTVMLLDASMNGENIFFQQNILAASTASGILSRPYNSWSVNELAAVWL